MSNVQDPSSQNQTKVVELSAFKKKRDAKEEIARSRKPLYVNHAEGTVTGKSAKGDGKREDFADRLVKIRGSLDRINQLMTEIKKLSKPQH